MTTSQQEPDFVLVHGAFSDSSVWGKLVAPLTAAGATVTCVVLPGHTIADTAEAGKTTLDDYVDTAADAVTAAAQPVILVGHSLSGMTITQVAQNLPEKISALVYVCAFLPEDGRTATSYAQTDTESLFGKNFTPDGERGIGTMTRHGLEETVFNRTSEEEKDVALATILPEPLQPFVAPVRTSADRFGTIPRYYITTTDDHALTPDLQARMLAALPCAKVYSLDSDHMPMMSATEGVVDALLDVRAAIADRPQPAASP